ncbi:MBOAT family O-acyltransferase [Paenibacillus sp. GCM10023252]|uniref:MBOAT family O-acyltransferase n=1 Tax=Paenibacillus sp. GCM10023252 TaxID=3252649 RepID=UPI00360EA039
MIFSTYSFIFLFLPITFFGYRLLNVLKLYPIAKLWLVFASLYFYAQGSAKFVFTFIIVIFFNYVISSMILNAESTAVKRMLLTLGLAQNILFLGYYKYSNFMIENYNAITGSSQALLNIVLPLGISFFTFQLIAHLVDCYRGQTKEHSVINFLVFITFFPQLLVGPIVHHNDFVPQLDNERQPFFNKANMMLGMFLFSVGCAKKILLADPLTGFAASFFHDIAAGDTLTAWTAVLSYTLSYYFDLSGYADMAIGLGLFFNIRLPQNFNSPYKARNFKEYWNRWHMTLSRFLSDYVFRTVYKRGSGSFRFYLSVMITFFVSGFWHGAGWKFILWGVINGVLVCAAHYMTRNKLKLPFVLAWTLTFLGVVATRILFVAADTAQAFDVMRMLVDFHQFAGMDVLGVMKSIAKFGIYHLYTLVLLGVAMFIAFFLRNTHEITEDFKPTVRHAFAAALCLGLSLVQMTSVSNFLYFQF